MIFREDINKDEVNELPLGYYEGETMVITNEKDLRHAFRNINREEVTGFDTETKPNFVKGRKHQISLIQIGLHERVYLIRLNKTGFHKEIKKFLENKRIKKVGVSLKDDLRGLRELNNFEPGGFIDLNQIVSDLGIKGKGLRKLTAITLGFRVSKSQQTSNWEKPVLNAKQIRYAATDAWCCLQIYRSLLTRGFIHQS